MLKVDMGLNNLLAFRYKKRFEAGRGQHGKGKDQQGRRGDGVVLGVPPGTEVWRLEGGERRLVADLEAVEQSVVVVRGGRGGRGNARFATPTNRTPVLAEEGEEGEEWEVELELKLLADVGIIGLPNAGKSSLLASSSAASPKIADYPFTTLEPVLGVVQTRRESLVAVDIPGLVEGAHLGRGLGIQFLQHVERTKVLLHVIDGSSGSPNEDWRKVNEELRSYSHLLSDRLQLVAVNKIDLPGVKERMADLKKELGGQGRNLMFISAATGEGIDALWGKALELVKDAAATGRYEAERQAVAVLRPRGRTRDVSIHRQGGVLVVDAPRAARLAARADLRDWPARLQLYKKLEDMGVVAALEEAGVKEGEVVRIGKVEMEWR